MEIVSYIRIPSKTTMKYEAKQDKYIMDPRMLNLLQKFCQSTNTFGWSINTFGQK